MQEFLECLGRGSKRNRAAAESRCGIIVISSLAHRGVATVDLGSLVEREQSRVNISPMMQSLAYIEISGLRHSSVRRPGNLSEQVDGFVVAAVFIAVDTGYVGSSGDGSFDSREIAPYIVHARSTVTAEIQSLTGHAVHFRLGGRVEFFAAHHPLRGRCRFLIVAVGKLYRCQIVVSHISGSLGGVYRGKIFASRGIIARIIVHHSEIETRRRCARSLERCPSHTVHTFFHGTEATTVAHLCRGIARQGAHVDVLIHLECFGVIACAIHAVGNSLHSRATVGGKGIFSQI
ncbi:hypothetical protein IMSAGC008_00415 [Muribaculaceae bacterium]|nr:hypothetical protein IMSAGC008_00415 [Muribaculaceae bacterium]